jgi:hypothetical protein
MQKDSATSSPLEVTMINGPVLHEMARSLAREREEDATAARPGCEVVTDRRAPRVSARVARAWGVLWRRTNPTTGGRRRHHVLRQHEEYEGW